jgi:protein TonB
VPKLARGQVGVLLYDPPPPPAPPLPRGSGNVSRTARPQARPEVVPVLVTPVEVEAPVPVETIETRDVASGGSPTGSARGVAEGEEYGRDGGVEGGLPDGVDGGAITGTGTVPLPVPVTGYERVPVRIRMVDPVYPPDAFAKKIEGVVEVEMLIDVDGRVVRARVTRSIPQLDAAAVAAVSRWLFTPAMKNGRPVPSLAKAPVRFTIH